MTALTDRVSQAIQSLEKDLSQAHKGALAARCFAEASFVELILEICPKFGIAPEEFPSWFQDKIERRNALAERIGLKPRLN